MTSSVLAPDWSTLTLSNLQQVLPPPPKPVGSYVPVVRMGDLLFTSGVLPFQGGQLFYKGRVGGYTVSVAQAQEAARWCVLNALSVVQSEAGDLAKVVRVVKLGGYVSSAPDFYQQPQVMNGASDLLVQLFGERGRHARTAVGVSALPLNASVELDLVVQVSSR